MADDPRLDNADLHEQDQPPPLKRQRTGTNPTDEAAATAAPVTAQVPPNTTDAGPSAPAGGSHSGHPDPDASTAMDVDTVPAPADPTATAEAEAAPKMDEMPAAETVVAAAHVLGQLPDVVVFAVDFSGSTNSSPEYWKGVGERYTAYLNEFGADKVVPIRWDHQIIPTTHQELETAIERYQGNGGTAPQVVAQYLVDKHGVEFNVIKLCLLTDGAIARGDVDQCDRILEDAAARDPATGGGDGANEPQPAFRIPHVEACLFGEYRPDLSVVAPFARHTQFVIRDNHSVLAQGDSRLVLDTSAGVLEADIKAPQDLFDRFEELNNAIVVQNLGRSNPKLRDALLKLQARLLGGIADENKKRAAVAMREAIKAGGIDLDKLEAEDAGDKDKEGAGGYRVRHPIARALKAGKYDVALAMTIVNRVNWPSAAHWHR